MSDPAMVNREIVRQVRQYYTDNQIFYNVLWTEPSTLSMNYGLWARGTRTHAQALANQNRLVEELLQPTADGRVLEAGCGTGGTSIWLAKARHSRVYGITICENQAEMATAHAHAREVADRVRFAVMDFTQTAFRDATFSGIFASESVCHAELKRDFLVEAFRLLQPGGRLVVIDGFLRKPDLAGCDRQMFDEWCRGWAVPNLATIEDFDRELRRSGFEDVMFRDLTELTRPASRRIHRLGCIGYPILWVLHRIRIASSCQLGHARACLRQRELVARGICGHGVFSARRPAAV